MLVAHCLVSGSLPKFILGLLWLSVGVPANAVHCIELLDNPILLHEPTRVELQSNRHLLTVRIGTLQKGKNAILNEALDLAAEYGIPVVVQHTEALTDDPFYRGVAEQQNRAGGFSTYVDSEPFLALGSALDPEFAVHEITHLKDYVAKLKRLETQGLSRAQAKRVAAMSEQTLPEHREWERRAVRNQLRYRYRQTGFNLWDGNLIERLIYPEVAVLLTRDLIKLGEGDGLTSRDMMDGAIWKALVIQRLRFRALMAEAAAQRNRGETAEASATELRANELKRATILFNEMFPPSHLGEGDRYLLVSLFKTQFMGQLARLTRLRGNDFTIDRE